LLGRARRAHESRGEAEAAARIVGLEVGIAQNTPDETALVVEQARILRDELFDEEGARVANLRILELAPDEPNASAAVSEGEEKRSRWQELCQTYLDEASSAPDDVYKSSMLMHAAEMEVRFGGENPDLAAAVERLEQAVRLDPSNDKAGRLLELVHRRAGKWEEVARVLERLADRAETVEQRVGASVRLARVYAQHLSDQERAARAYEGALRQNPNHAEAHYQLGVVLEARGDRPAAADAFVKATQANPQMAYAHFYAAMNFYEAKRVDRMATYFENFLKLAPNAPERPAVESIMRTVRGR
jgi:tetratricopeptide (TPR) repeat protein